MYVGVRDHKERRWEGREESVCVYVCVCGGVGVGVRDHKERRWEGREENVCVCVERGGNSVKYTAQVIVEVE